MKEATLKAELALDIQNFIARFWEDVDMNEGREAADHFAENAVFDAKMVCFRGREEIREWYRWRESAGRVARHLLTNIHFDFEDFSASGKVNIRALMTHFGADGKGVRPIAPPIAIYDYSMRLQHGGDYGWIILELITSPVFLATDHVALRYADKIGE